MEYTNNNYTKYWPQLTPEFSFFVFDDNYFDYHDGGFNDDDGNFDDDDANVNSNDGDGDVDDDDSHLYDDVCYLVQTYRIFLIAHLIPEYLNAFMLAYFFSMKYYSYTYSSLFAHGQ